MNVLDLEGKKVLLRPEVAEGANKSNVVIGEPRKEAGNKEARRQITLSRQVENKSGWVQAEKDQTDFRHATEQVRTPGRVKVGPTAWETA